jgi:hypothetical protein
MNIPKSVIPTASTMRDERSAYEKSSKENLKQLINDLELTELHKQSLRSRWLDQVSWMGKKARHCQRWYYILRLIAIIGALIVPALVGLNPAAFGDANIFAANLVISLTFGLSLLVAICVATEEFFHFGERWRHYRSTAERLKIEGWQFFQLAGPYQDFKTHEEAYSIFATRTESIQQQEVDVFITEIAKEKKKEQEAKNPNEANK